MAEAARVAAVATFTKWVNARLRVRAMEIANVTTDLTDGVVLINLLEVLKKQPFNTKWNQKPKGVFQEEENCKLAVAFIIEQMGIKMVGIGGEDIAHGHAHLTLALIWHLILRYQVGTSVEGMIGEKESAETALLNWARETAGKLGVPVNDFSGSWADGRAFAALVSVFFPEVLPWPVQGDATAVFGAFTDACKALGVEVFLEVGDLLQAPAPDKQVIMTEVAELCAFFADTARVAEARRRLARLADINARLAKLVEGSSGETKSVLGELQSTLKALTAGGLKYCGLCGEIFAALERLCELARSSQEAAAAVNAAKALAEAELIAARERIKELEASAAGLKAELAKAQGGSSAQAGQIAALESSAAAQASQLAAAAEREKAASKEASDLKAKVKELEDRIAELEKALEKASVKPLRYRWGPFTGEMADAVKAAYVERFGDAGCKSWSDFAELLTDFGVNLEYWELLFRLLDSDGSGTLDKLEVFTLLDLLVGVNLRDPDAQGWAIFKLINADHSGFLTAAELSRFLQAAGRGRLVDQIKVALAAQKKAGLTFGELWGFLQDGLGVSPSESERLLRALGGFGSRPVRTPSDLAYRLTNCGWDIREAFCVGLFKLCDRDGNGVLEAQEFLLLLCELDKVELSDPTALDRVMFRVLDVDGNSVLDAGELTRYSECIGCPLSRTAIEQYLKTEGKKGLSYDEFVKFEPSVVRDAAARAAEAAVAAKGRKGRRK